MKFVSYSRNIIEYDGVSNSVLYFNNFFSQFYNTELVAIEKNIDQVIDFESYIKNHVEANIFFYHFSIYDFNLENILNLKFKYKIIYFHGITPPSMLHSEVTKDQCRFGINQIKLLDDFDLYLFNSPASKKQFFHNLGNEFDKKSFVIPPIDMKKR